MSRLLQAPGVASEARSVGRADPLLDPAVAAAVDRAAADAYARGRRDGSAAATAAVERAAAAGLDAVRRAAEELHAVAADADAELALEIARVVLGGEPSRDPADLLRRIAESLAALDEERVTVRVHPEHAEHIAAGVAALSLESGAAVEVVADPGIPAGEAQLSGRWARADLTRAGALAAIEDLLSQSDRGELEEAGRAA